VSAYTLEKWDADAGEWRFHAVGEDFTAQPASVKEYAAKDGNGKFYAVSLEGGGFVVTSGDTELEPVLAYSKDGTWIDDVTQNPLLAMLPIDVAAAMTATGTTGVSPVDDDGGTGTTGVSPVGGRRLAASSATAGTAVVPVNGQDARSPSAKAAKWAEFIAAAAPKKGGARLQSSPITSNPSDLRVGKLLTTRWSQGSPNYTRVAYNYYTPTAAANGNYRLYCGCVATAGGQIMYYHKWPQSSVTLLKNYSQTFENGRMYNAEDGYQTTQGGAYVAWDVPFGGTYDWNNMGGTSSTANKQAIGKLLRDVGISCYMKYGSDGSAAGYRCLYWRLQDQFGYANAAFQYGDVTEDYWKRAILASLDAKLPVAVEVPGHAIVADGYGYQGGTLYVHFNFGWEGSSDAWYNAPDLTSADAAYSKFNSLVYNIYPQGTPNCTIVSGRLKNASGTAMSGAMLTAVNRSSGSRVTATTDDKGIYAFKLLAGEYAIGIKDNAGRAAGTNLTVEACESTEFVNDTMENEKAGYYYAGTGRVKNIPLVDMQLVTVAVPEIYPADGTTFYGPTRNVSIGVADSGVEVRYTTDGSEPTAESTLYTGPFTVSATTTIKAKAFVCGEWSGAMASATLTKGTYYGGGGLYPDTPKNRASHWLDERAEMSEATGSWSPAVAYDGTTAKASLDGTYTFTCTTPSGGKKATLILTEKFVSMPYAEGTPDDNAQAAIWMGTNGSFQVWTVIGQGKGWLDVAAAGVTPTLDVDYTFRLKFNYRNNTYSAEVLDGSTWKPLKASGNQENFANAKTSATSISAVRFDGELDFTSLQGEYERAKRGVQIIAY
jgi:hypothetical protein